MRRRQFLGALVACSPLVVAGCTVDYQPYEGRNAFRDGEGGTRVTVDGVDIWSNGTPPRRYEILGVLTIEVGGGAGAASVIRAEAASRVKAAGGDAAIQMDATESVSGMVMMSNVAIPSRRLTTRFLVIRYDETQRSP